MWEIPATQGGILQVADNIKVIAGSGAGGVYAWGGVAGKTPDIDFHNTEGGGGGGIGSGGVGGSGGGYETDSIKWC